MKFDSINHALDWLENQHNNKSHRNNDKIKIALERLGNPHKTFPVIHVTGTNGKGSTTSFIKNILMSQGLNVGTFTSPHIEKINERISLNGQPISDENLQYAIEKLYDVNEYLATTSYGRLVFFENYTVLMAIYFQMKQPDVVIVEVGIGGLIDATNVMDGDVAVITTIGIDHVDKLGGTFEEVARHKAGIIKHNARVITGNIVAEALPVIEEVVRQQEAMLYKYNVEFGTTSNHTIIGRGSTFDYWFKNQKINNVQISMLGDYQIDNAAVAITASLNWLDLHQHTVNIDELIKAVATTRWIGRMECVHESPLIYIDGAHNVQGIEALRQLVTQNFGERHIQILYAGLNKKNQDAHLEILSGFTSDKVYLTTFSHFEAMRPEEYQEIIDKHHLPQNYFEIREDWQSLINNYLQEADDNQLLLITGSLYFISDVRKYIKEKQQ